MPPLLAAFVYLGFIVFLFQRDFRERPNVTRALWLPFFWLFISGSRFVSEWLALFGLNLGTVNVEEGSPVDALFFFILIAGAVRVLVQRRVSYVEFARHNRWVAFYLLYCLVAIVWSDYPFVAFKRWIKLFGQPVMVLVLLTEPDPMEAVACLLKRCAYVWIPISLLFIKYFPQWGCGFDNWSGAPMITGITKNKNALGCDCFILGLFFLWHFVRVRRRERGAARRNELILCLIFFVMIGWLVNIAHSSTALGSLVLGVTIMLSLGFRFVNRRRIGVYVGVLLIVGILGETLFGLHKFVIEALGRNDTLTNRTEIWHILLNWDVNPLLGTGFETFWLGLRSDQVQDAYGAFLNEAHNGYLETYLNLGLMGLVITLVMLLATYFKTRRELLEDFDYGRFRLAYLVAFMCYNWTEAAFRTHALPFFMFFLIAIDYPTGPFLETSPVPDLHPEPAGFKA